MAKTPHGAKKRLASGRTLDETVVENAIRQRDRAQIDAANAKAEISELEGEMTQWRSRAYELIGVMRRMADDPKSSREDVQATLNVVLSKHNWG
jgi:hypothetical protein